jgi:iron complex outermembrane receptor protein
MGRVAAKLNQNWSAGIGFLAVDTEVGDPANTNRYDIKANSVNTFLNHQHGDWNGELKVFYNSGYAISTEYTGKYEFVHSGVRWSEQFKPWLGGGVKLGVNYDSTDGTNINTSTGAPTNLTAIRWTSPYVALNHSFDISNQWAITPSIGYRGYSHSLYSSKGTPFAGLTLASDSWRYFANVSTGLKYPGLELQSYAALNAADLTAEKVDHTEFGVGYRPSDSTDIALSIFQDKVTNRYFTTGYFGQSWSQTGAYDIRGIEFTVKQALSRQWNVFFGATHLDPSLYNLPYAPDLAITIGLTGKLGPVSVSIDAQSQTSFYGLNWGRAGQGSGSINSSSTTKLDGFTVVNTRLGYPVPALGKRGEVFLAVENLTDENYRYRSESSYQMPGRWAQIGLVASFN